MNQLTVTMNGEQREILEDFAEMMGFTPKEAAEFLLQGQLIDWYEKVIAPRELKDDLTKKLLGAKIQVD